MNSKDGAANMDMDALQQPPEQPEPPGPKMPKTAVVTMVTTGTYGTPADDLATAIKLFCLGQDALRARLAQMGGGRDGDPLEG